MANKDSLSLAVHLHLHYTDMWNEIRGYLANIESYPYHLYITMTQENAALVQEIQHFHKDTTIYIVKNKGYDVGPFIHFLNCIDLKKYDLILKIHTKNNKSGCDTLLNNRYVSRADWFRLLIEALIGSQKIFQKNINTFQKNEYLGMIGSKYCITSNMKNSMEVRDKVIGIMNELQFNKFLPITFVAGTMFFIRSSLLQKIKDKYTIDDFPDTDSLLKDGTLAHVLERVFGCLVMAQGYKIRGYDKNRKFEFCGTLSLIRRFVYQRKITKSNHILIKVFKIPVYHRKLLQG